MFDLLAENQLLLLFTVIGLGYLIGNISIFGFKLGVAAVLFTGIAFSAIDNRLSLPDYIYIIGLVLFVYAIGLQSGPAFFASFRARGLRFSILAILILAGGAILSGILARILGVSAPSIAGLFCGALTNTPALAATVEAARTLSANLPPDQQAFYSRAPVVTYGLAYPFGVFGVILWFYLSSRFFKVDLAGEKGHQNDAASVTIYSKTFRISNPAVVGKKLADILGLMRDTGFVVSRTQKGGTTDVAMPDTVLEPGDLIVAVGDFASMERARILFGEEMEEHIPADIGGITTRRVYVSNKAVAGKRIHEIRLQNQFHATITRLRRGDVDFVPMPDTVIELGDRIRVVARESEIEQVTQYFGDSVRGISETDYLSLSLGIVLGVFLGMIPIPLPNGLSLKLGFAGGPLIAGLILGRLQRTGPIIWDIPYNANLVLRQVGLVFFLAAIGTKAGSGLIETFQKAGFGFIIAGAIITTAVTLSTIFIGYKYLKLPMGAVMGMMSGIQTQPACLAYANQQVDNELPNIWYATVYPAAMVAKIFLAQIIVSWLIM